MVSGKLRSAWDVMHPEWNGYPPASPEMVARHAEHVDDGSGRRATRAGLSLGENGTGMLCKPPPYGGIRTIDLRTGKTLWEDTLPAGGQATPIIYEMNGKQYLVI